MLLTLFFKLSWCGFLNHILYWVIDSFFHSIASNIRIKLSSFNEVYSTVTTLSFGPRWSRQIITNSPKYFKSSWNERDTIGRRSQWKARENGEICKSAEVSWRNIDMNTKKQLRLGKIVSEACWHADASSKLMRVTKKRENVHFKLFLLTLSYRSVNQLSVCNVKRTKKNRELSSQNTKW